jgi:Ran GTPase-activating protein (RanGAP) involved in mRNA processing and transport
MMTTTTHEDPFGDYSTSSRSSTRRCKLFRRGSSEQDVLTYLRNEGSDVKELMVCEVDDFSDSSIKEMEEVLIEYHNEIHLQRLELPQNGLTSAAGGPLARIVLAQHETLQTLNLSYNPLSHEGFSHLVNPLSTTFLPTSRVIHLDLTDTGLGSKGAKLVASLLRNNSCLQDLRLGNNKLGPKGLKALVTDVAAHPTLERLDIPNNDIKCRGIALLAQALMNNTLPGVDGSTSSQSSRCPLRHLDITCNQIGPQGMSALVTMLILDRRISTLHCGTNHLGPEGADHLALVLKHNYTLKELFMEENGIGPAAASRLVEQLVEEGGNRICTSALERLNLARNSIGEVGATKLAQVLKTNTVLTDIDLAGNNIGSMGAVQLAEALANNLNLSRLTLSDNGIGDRGAFALADTLGNPTCPLDFDDVDWTGNLATDIGLASLNRVSQIKRNRKYWLGKLLRDLWHGSVHSVDLSERNVGDEEVILLANTIKESNRPLLIRSLRLRGILFTPRSLVPLAQASIPFPAVLMRLYLQNCCNMGMESVEAIATCLDSSESLQVLSLVDCCIDEQGAAQIANALATNKSLRRLNLDRNRIGDVGLKAIADKLPHATLISLSANDNGITDISMASLNLTRIRELHLKKNSITDRGALQFASSLAGEGDPWITWLSLQQNEVTNKGAQAIRLFMSCPVPGGAFVDC